MQILSLEDNKHLSNTMLPASLLAWLIVFYKIFSIALFVNLEDSVNIARLLTTILGKTSSISLTSFAFWGGILLGSSSN